MFQGLLKNWKIWNGGVPFILLLLVLLLLLYESLLTRIVKAQAPVSYELGKRTYRIACSACHGKNGDGETPFAKSLDPKPRTFTKGSFKFRSTFPGVLPTDEDLRKIIKQGIRGTSMPAWKDVLSESEIKAVIDYIKNFSPFFTQWTDFDTLAYSPPPSLTKQGIARGKEIYKIMGCWNCHGMQGRGNGPSAKGLLDEEKRPIKPYDFTTGNMKGGSEMSDIYKTLAIGLRGTPMPSFYGTFLFTREGLEELLSKGIFQNYFSVPELNSLKKFAQTVSSESELKSLDSTQVEQIAEQRRWDLVQYVYSLRREPNLFKKLFATDYEATR